MYEGGGCRGIDYRGNIDRQSTKIPKNRHFVYYPKMIYYQKYTFLNCSEIQVQCTAIYNLCTVFELLICREHCTYMNLVHQSPYKNSKSI